MIRTLVFPLSFLLLGLGFTGILFQRDRRALHDMIAGTAVVYYWPARAARLRFLDRPTPDQAAPDQAAPDQAAPDQAAPDQAAPDQAAPDQAAPDQAAPDQAPPGPDTPAELA